MSVVSVSSLYEGGVLGVPDADALVQAAGGYVAVVGRDGHGGDSIFYLECEDALILLDIPQTNCTVAGAGCDVTTVSSEVERVDVLLVAVELVADDFVGDIPNLSIRLAL